ncbi:hypothetical protein [Sphingomonas sp. SRS2]|uniref:hypothetical protein n=1 Tax=Sphingomonas sp. SRS2 TaxID=133190 RepID=UPI0006184700|nr:hypothetical protein [Sphingomonas sp. SRS2]KKC24912.1 hypothetical protein WP12_16955 [Sphingomonas sp. SRS2]
MRPARQIGAMAKDPTIKVLVNVDVTVAADARKAPRYAIEHAVRRRFNRGQVPEGGRLTITAADLDPTG